MSSGYLGRSNIEDFWGEMAPCDHLIQIYDDQGAFLDALEGFIAGGLRAGDSTIVIATAIHLHNLEQRLGARRIDLAVARANDQYIPLDAAETLSKFMVGGWPDDELFQQVVTELLARARHGGRRVRAFGEMVAVLWARGDQAATVRLEHLWNELCQARGFSLFCAYPKVGFTQDATASISQLCAAHSKVISAN
jgi:DcmR-like sensory protein